MNLDVVNMLMPIAVVAIMYFFFIKPQNDQRKAQEDFESNLSKGMKVVTSSGIFGQISKVDEHSVLLQVDGKTTIQFTKSAISKELTEQMYSEKKA